MEFSRKIIIFQAVKDISLDYNYHYPLMIEIYKSLEISNPTLAKSLHDKGFRIENKTYKLFTNQFFIPNAKYTKDYIFIKKGTRCKLIVSGLNKIVKNIVFGFMDKGNLNLNQNIFEVLSVENDTKVRFDNITLYKVRNPIVATKQNEKRSIVYINPLDQDFYKVLANNLKRKYKLIYDKDYEGDLYFDIEDIFSIKKKLIKKIKSEYMIIGYHGFELYLEANKDMQQVAYYCGLGSYNSLGMGAITYITSRRD